jgi:multiple sugar transport system substrate-binding protein
MKKICNVCLISLVVILLFGMVPASAKVTIITWDTATARGIQKLIPEFTKETGIEVNMEIYGEAVLREKVMLDLAAQTGTYDIFLLDGWLTGEYAEAGYVRALDDLVKNKPSKYNSIDDFAPIYLDALRYKGKLYGLPYYGHVGILMYRKDLFEAKGIKAPTTTAELLAAAKALNKPPEMYGIAFRGKKGEDNTIITTSWTWVFGGEWLDEKNNPAVTSPEFVKGVTWIKDILQYAPPDVSNYTWMEVEKSFTTGKVAMIFDASDFIGRIENPQSSGIAGKIGYALAPAGPCCPNTERYPSHLFTAGMGISAYSKNVDDAWAFLQWMTSTDVQRKTAIESGNTGITSRKVLGSEEFQKAYPGIDVMLKAQELANPNFMPHIPCYSELCDIIGTHISAVIAGAEQPKEAMDKAAAEMLVPLKGCIK